MRRHLAFFAAVLCSAFVAAETYTILFNSGTADSSSPTSELNSIIYSATDNCVESIVTAEKIYRAKEGFGIKGGTGSAKGELTLRLDDSYTVSTLTVYAASYAHKDDSVSTAKIRRGLVVNGTYFAWKEGHCAEIRPYSQTIGKAVTEISIVSDTAKSNRWYVQKIEFEAPDPHPDKTVLTMQYATLDLGAVSWVSEDEPIEDVIDFEVAGKNINGPVALTMKNGAKSKFTVTPASVPAAGGEASISYSITMSAAPDKAIPYKDTVIATAKGKDDITYTRKLPVELTIKPKSTGPGTFDLDTTRMAIGDMQGDYYKYAQGTADSTLKNHLGAIICCGKRYRYGSGTRKTWDAFFYTDRNPETNQVLDMYSNNVRYFDPERPTASVPEFDIEHMLPKSWWGGNVNPAYCDLYHLVPGDYSANRSKSNHAPGIPADSTFNNGSFVTGSGAAYGLTRVFCPADEYKGDFARAYFYIVTCYGDSLVWLESGEPGAAMTNEGWQEFRPWLRDLLVEWHRMDPVSEKELKRAREVNKIQGNRNPFIDYPELVEYIWGEKQGQPVDFYLLQQSYGTPYDDESQNMVSPACTASVRKFFRDGKLLILRNASIYSTLGQRIR